MLNFVAEMVLFLDEGTEILFVNNETHLYNEVIYGMRKSTTVSVSNL